jgi:hypothetical protein
MQTSINITPEMIKMKNDLGMTWIGMLKLALKSRDNSFKTNELEAENKELKERLQRTVELLQHYIELSKVNTLVK